MCLGRFAIRLNTPKEGGPESHGADDASLLFFCIKRSLNVAASTEQDDGVDILLCKCRVKKREIRNDLISRLLRILLVPRAGVLTI